MVTFSGILLVFWRTDSATEVGKVLGWREPVRARRASRLSKRGIVHFKGPAGATPDLPGRVEIADRPSAVAASCGLPHQSGAAGVLSGHWYSVWVLVNEAGR